MRNKSVDPGFWQKRRCSYHRLIYAFLCHCAIVAGRPATKMRLSERIERDFQVAHAIVFGLGQFATTDVDLYGRQ